MQDIRNPIPMQEFWFLQMISKHLSRTIKPLYQSYHEKVQITNYHTFATTKTAHYSYKDTCPITQSQMRSTTLTLREQIFQSPAQRPTLISPLQHHCVNTSNVTFYSMPHIPTKKAHSTMFYKMMATTFTYTAFTVTPMILSNSDIPLRIAITVVLLFLFFPLFLLWNIFLNDSSNLLPLLGCLL